MSCKAVRPKRGRERRLGIEEDGIRTGAFVAADEADDRVTSNTASFEVKADQRIDATRRQQWEVRVDDHADVGTPRPYFIEAKRACSVEVRILLAYVCARQSRLFGDLGVARDDEDSGHLPRS